MCGKEKKEVIESGKDYGKNIVYMGESFRSVMNFFGSDYGQALCEISGIAATTIVDYLNDYREQTIRRAIAERSAKRGRR